MVLSDLTDTLVVNVEDLTTSYVWVIHHEGEIKGEDPSLLTTPIESV